MLIWSHFWLPLPDHRSNNNKRRHAAQQFRSRGSIPKWGILEVGYETFAAAVATSGFIGAAGGGGWGRGVERRRLSVCGTGFAELYPQSSPLQGKQCSTKNRWCPHPRKSIQFWCVGMKGSSNPDLPPSINNCADNSIEWHNWKLALFFLRVWPRRWERNTLVWWMAACISFHLLTVMKHLLCLRTRASKMITRI